MEYTYKISKTHCYVSIVLKDLTTCQGVKMLLDEIVSDKKYNRSYNFLVDLRQLKYTPIIPEMEQLSKCVISFKEHLHGSVALVTNNEIQHYLFKYAAILLSKNGLKYRVFCEPENALNWLLDYDNASLLPIN